MVTPSFQFPIGWRWVMAVAFFCCAMLGFSSGVSLSEDPDVYSRSILAKAYYSLGLFVLGGLDFGIPTEGPLTGRVLLWTAYFGSPLLAASAVVEAVLSTLARRRWRMKWVRDHIVVVGTGDTAISYLRVLRSVNTTTPVVVVNPQIDPMKEMELSETFDALVVHGDVTHEFMLRELRLHRARRVMLFGDDDVLSFEAASKIIRLYPDLVGNIVIHCTSLRFLRAIQDSSVAASTERFNSYNLAAKGLVRDTLLNHFRKTPGKDTVVIAGFGMFGQTILEELQLLAPEHIGEVAVIDAEANRQVHIVDEQFENRFSGDQRKVFDGDISHPEVWRQATGSIDLSKGEPVVIFGTGESASNLRTALWFKRGYPNALVFFRTMNVLEFAQAVGRDHDVHPISIIGLVEGNVPQAWLT